MKRMPGLAAVMAAVIFTTSFATVYAQEAAEQGRVPYNTFESGSGSGSGVGQTIDYYMGNAAKDVLMIKVNVWGQVKRPGHYSIPIKTDLVSFLSFAGGPEEKAKLDNVKIIRHENGNSEVLKINVKKYLNTADLALIPELKPGDTVIVAGSILHLFSTTVQYLTQLMTVITFYNIVTQLGK